MFSRKPKIANVWSITKNPNKFDEDIMLTLGSSNGPSEEDVYRNFDIKEQVSIRLTKVEARKLCATITEYIGE